MSLFQAIPNLIKTQLRSRMLSAVVGRHWLSGPNAIFGWSRSRSTAAAAWHPNRSVTSAPTLQSRSLLDVAFASTPSSRSYTLYQMHALGPPKVRRVKQRPLDGNPFMKGVVLKTLIKNPKKPNSGNRKCVLLRLSNGKEKLAHVPGVGHSLQEHNIVLVKCRRLKDTPGVWLKVIRGKYDCTHVVRKPHYTKK